MLTLPHELRQRIAYDRKLLASIGRIFVSSVLGFYRHRLCRRDGARGGKSGTVFVVQRSSADLKLNPYLHAIFLDAAYHQVGDGDQPTFTGARCGFGAASWRSSPAYRSTTAQSWPSSSDMLRSWSTVEADINAANPTKEDSPGRYCVPN
jgi:hypothetical protein